MFCLLLYVQAMLLADTYGIVVSHLRPRPLSPPKAHRARRATFATTDPAALNLLEHRGVFQQILCKALPRPNCSSWHCTGPCPWKAEPFGLAQPCPAWLCRLASPGLHRALKVWPLPSSLAPSLPSSLNPYLPPACPPARQPYLTSFPLPSLRPSLPTFAALSLPPSLRLSLSSFLPSLHIPHTNALTRQVRWRFRSPFRILALRPRWGRHVSPILDRFLPLPKLEKVILRRSLRELGMQQLAICVSEMFTTSKA